MSGLLDRLRNPGDLDDDGYARNQAILDMATAATLLERAERQLRQANCMMEAQALADYFFEDK